MRATLALNGFKFILNNQGIPEELIFVLQYIYIQPFEVAITNKCIENCRKIFQQRRS